ncbi:MAG: hypothetical protein DMG06_03115 [Acidobacteria bacterium]|nr:MAG: hypothetical protein DMG06_03115 [Acidobacteriota bacterium]
MTTISQKRHFLQHRLHPGQFRWIRPIIGQIYPLKEAGQALKALESRSTYGKLLLHP